MIMISEEQRSKLHQYYGCTNSGDDYVEDLVHDLKLTLDDIIDTFPIETQELVHEWEEAEREAEIQVGYSEDWYAAGYGADPE